MSSAPMTIPELQELAERMMPPDHREFVSGGTGANWTRDRNRTKLDEIALNPRLLRAVDDRDLSTTVLDEEISFPVMSAPAGAQWRTHPDGELATTRAAGAAGTLMALPVGSAYSIEEVAEAATGPLWFQHIHYNDAITENFLPRLKPAGYSALILTVDALGPFPLEEALSRSQSAPSLGRMFGSLRDWGELVDEHGLARWTPPNITWDRLGWIRSLSGGLPLVIKGIRNAEDALLCVEHGVDGVVVSNHGGRQFDGGRSSIEVLPEVAEAAGDRLEVYLDSGIRSGLDVFRALALGARAVFVGRPMHWGLAYDGEAGVRRALEILRAEFDKVLAYSGCTHVGDITGDYVVLPD